MADPEGAQGVHLNPLPNPRFQIFYDNEIFWSQCIQIISLSWDIAEKCDKISKANPQIFIHSNPLLTNSGSAPVALLNHWIDMVLVPPSGILKTMTSI